MRHRNEAFRRVQGLAGVTQGLAHLRRYRVGVVWRFSDEFSFDFGFLCVEGVLIRVDMPLFVSLV